MITVGQCEWADYPTFQSPEGVFWNSDLGYKVMYQYDKQKPQSPEGVFQNSDLSGGPISRKEDFLSQSPEGVFRNSDYCKK